MAAVDEGGSQSENKNEFSLDSNCGRSISLMQQEVESQVCRENASYSDKVNAVLRGWECLASNAHSSASHMISFATFLYNRGDYSGASLRTPRIILSQVPPPLICKMSTCSLSPQEERPCTRSDHTTGVAYLSSEPWDVVRMRVDALLEARCEQFAYRVLTVCSRSLRDPECTLPVVLDDDREHFTDLYYVLLYKFDRNAFLNEVKQLPVEEGVALVQRLLHRTDTTSRVWKNRLKIADIASKVFLATTIVKEYSEIFWHVFSEWCGVQLSVGVSHHLLEEMVRKYICLAYSQQHLYTMGSVLQFKCDGQLQSLVIELLIRGLTLDMNDIETLKLQHNEVNNSKAVADVEQRMSLGFLELASVFEQHAVVSRECVLTAFSLHPTEDKLQKLQQFADQELTSSPSKIIVSGSVQVERTPEKKKEVEQPAEKPEPSQVTPGLDFVDSEDPEPNGAVNADVIERAVSPSLAQSTPAAANSDTGDFPTSLTTPCIAPSAQEPTNHTSPGYTSPGYTSPAHLSPCPKNLEMNEETFKARLSPIQGPLVPLSINVEQNQLSENEKNLLETETVKVGSVNIVVDTGQPPTSSLSSVESHVNTNGSQEHIFDSIPSPLAVEKHSSKINETTVERKELQSENLDDSLLESISNNGANKSVFSEASIPPVSVSLPIESDSSIHVTSDSSTQANFGSVLPFSKNVALNRDSESQDIKLHELGSESLITSATAFSPEDETETSPISHSLIPATSTLGANCDILTNPGEVLDENKLGLPKELCDDLAVVLSSPRWQGLSWMFGWRHLGPLCQKYFVDANAVKNLTKELKYLDIDYAQFRHLPCVEVDEFSGIEKGYEQFMYEEDTDVTEPACDQTLVLMNQKQNLDNELRPNRGRGKVKSSYYDSDSDYDSGGFQKFRSAESDSDGEGFGNVCKVVDKNRSGRSSDGGWVDNYVGKHRVKKVTHKDRRKRLRIDQAIESVIARHTQDVNSSANSSTNDDSLDNSTGESDVADTADSNDSKTNSIPNVVMIGNRSSGVGGRATSAKSKSASIHSSRALMMKKYNVPNRLRFFRKPGLPYQPGSEAKSKKSPSLSYSIGKATSHELKSPLQFVQGNVRCPLTNFYGHTSKARAPHLISVPQRLPGPRTILSLNSSKELPDLATSKTSSNPERSDSPEIIELNPRDAINSVRTIKSVMYNSKGIPIGTLSSSTSQPVHGPNVTARHRKQSPNISQTFHRQLKQEIFLRNKMASVRTSQSPPSGQPLRYSTQDSSLSNSSTSSPVSIAETLKQEIGSSLLLQSGVPRLSFRSSQSRDEANPELADSGSGSAGRFANSKWRHPGCLYGPSGTYNSLMQTSSTRCTCKTSDGRVITVLPYGGMQNVSSGSGRNSDSRQADKSDTESTGGSNKTHNNGGRQLVSTNNAVPKTCSTSSSHAKSMNYNNSYKNKNSLTVQRPITAEAIAKILMEQEENGTVFNTKALLKNSSVTITRKQIPVQDVLDKRKPNKFSFDDRQPLASAQKNVLNRIMSHDNGFSSLSAAIRPPIRAMPVTHTPPNIVPDKNGTGLGRILPKGTTVVRKNQNDPSSSHSGAGPSGVNNGGGVSNANQNEPVRSRNALASRITTQAGPSRFIAQNVPSTSSSSVIHSNNSSAGVSGNSTQLPTSVHAAASTPVAIISSSSYVNSIIRSASRAGVTHHTVSSPAATFVITSNSSLSQVNASMVPIGNDRDGIILSSGIGNQVFTHSDGSNNNSGRDTFLDHNIIAVSSATARSNHLASSSSSSHPSINSNPTIASLLDASSVLEELASTESSQGLTNFPNTSMSSSNFLERNALSNTGGGASSGASPAPLDYATLVGGALNIGRTLGGAPGDERNIALSTASTVAFQPRDVSIPAERRSVSTVSNTDTDDSFINTATHVTTCATTRFGGNLISAGGGLLGRVLAASGVSGVRLLGGSCVSVTTESSPTNHTTLNSLSSSTATNTGPTSVGLNLETSVRNTMSDSGSSSVITSTDTSDFNHNEDTSANRVAIVTMSPGTGRSQPNGASSGVTSMLETLLRDSPSKRPSSAVNIKVSTSSGPSVMGSDNVPAPTTTTTTTTTTGMTSDVNNGSSNSISANSSLASLLSSGTVITSGNQIRITASSPVTQTLSSAAALQTNQSVSLELPESGNSETSSYLMRSSEDSITSNVHRSDLRYASGTALLDTGTVRGGGSVVLGAGSTSSSVLLNSGTSLPSNVVLAPGSSAPSNGVLLSPGGPSDNGAGLQQVLVPAQLVHVQTGDGSTGLGLVHSTGLDIRLPAGTRVIKSSGANSLLGGTMTRSGSSSNTAVAATSSALGSNTRQVNLLQNVKIVQNRQIVRTVVVPNSVTLQGIASPQSQGAHLVAISSGGASTALTSETVPLKVTTTKAGAARAIGGPCGLVIRTVRPQLGGHNSSADTVVHEKVARRLEVSDRAQVQIRSGRAPTDEGLAERLNRHYLKTVGQLNASTTVQSVGTQTQTTAVKNTAGQLVSQVVMNNIGGTATVSSLPTTAVLSVASSNTSQDSSLNALPLAHSNAVSSETLEQLREFESVFEKVSNKSTKDDDEVAPTVESFPVVMAPTTTSASSTEESMIAAQLLSMANETPVRSTPSYVYSLPSSVPQQPQPPASPALSTTSSHSSVASSPSSTPSKKKPQASKTKIVANACVASTSGSGGGTAGSCGGSNSIAVAATAPTASSTLPAAATASASLSTSSNPKTPPPKAPPKPQVAKPQVEDNDEIRARIKVILENYKMLLAETPQQQPAPRNRKNCPPSRSDSKSPGKKKSSSSGKKIDGSSTNSPIASDPGTSASPSPATSATPTPGSMAADGTTTTETNTVIQVASNLGSPSFPVSTDEKIPVLKSEGASPNVVVSNVKTEKSTIVGSVSNVQTLPQTIATGGRIVQLIRTGSKVTAITTRQPLYRTKHGMSASQSGGPPPNVTIQGRINMSNIMESHLASLLSGNTQPSILGKKIGNSDSAGGTVLLQTQTGQFIQANQIAGSVSAGNTSQVIQSIGGGQQVVHSAGSTALVQLPPGQQVIHTAAGQVVQLGATGALLSSGTQVVSAGGVGSNNSNSSSSDSSVQTVLPGGSAKVVQTSSGDATLHTVIPGDSAIVHRTAHGREGSTHMIPQQQTIVVQQQQQHLQHVNTHNPGVIKHTVSRSADSAGHDDNSDSEQTSDGVTLPPFFTLAKPFLGVSKSGNAGHSGGRKPGTAVTEAAAVVAAAVSLANQSKTSLSNVTLYSLETRTSVTTTSSAPNSAGSSSLSPSTPAPVSVNDDSRSSFQSSIADEGGLYRGVSDEGSSAYQGPTEETLLYSADRSALESGVRQQHLLPRSGAVLMPSSGRTSSLDSLKSDFSTEEVQVPPSPSTLTKQLQNAYMTDAALSPSLVQQQHQQQQLQHHLNTTRVLHTSLSLPNLGENEDRDKHHQRLRLSSVAASSQSVQQQSVESPSVSQDMHFPLSPSVYQSPQGSNSPTCVSGGVNPSCSASGEPGSASSSVMIQSPPGDVYLDGSGPALNSLDTMPLVAGMEGRVHSPALSDLVTTGTLLPWSPRSADSMMAQSPTIHDTLSANMGLDVPHSSDTLCDSSTPFPVLFSMEGDGASVSSNASEDLPFRTTSPQHCSLDEEAESPEVVGSAATSLQEHVSFSTQDHIGGLSSSCPSPDGQELRLNSDNGHTTHGCRRSALYSTSNAASGHTSQSPSTNIAEPIRDTPWRFESVLVSNIANVSSSPPRCSLLNCVNFDDEQEVDDVLSMDSKELSDGDDRKEICAKNVGESDADSEQLTSAISSATFTNEPIHVESEHGLILSEALISNVDKELKNEVKSENESESRFALMDSQDEEAKISDRKSKVADDKTYGGRRRSFGRKRPSDQINCNIEPEFESEPKRPKEQSDCKDVTHDTSATSPSLVNSSVTVSSTSVVTRSRNTISVSDANCNIDPATSQKPSLRDSPITISGKRRRCGSGITSGNASIGHFLNISQDCHAVCSANDSSNAIQLSLSSSGMTTRRASNRDHTKRQRCSCCSGDDITHSVSSVPSSSLLRPSSITSISHDCGLSSSITTNVTSTSESQCGTAAPQVHSSSLAEPLHGTSTTSTSSSGVACNSINLSNSSNKKGTSGGSRRTSARMNKLSGGFDAKINDKRR
ncbi:hypothetical protein FHG87_014578 [Trinorchestia longiramus]|nr:hypothetical protein FHG87_014578 [Trinorchestia longiramus]